MTRVPWIAPDDDATPFPDADLALAEPNGLLAIGGSLTPRRLVMAYRAGIFPWFAEDQPVLWWSPDPRAVIVPSGVRISRSLGKRLRREDYQVTLDRDFDAVIEGCAAPRDDQAGTWITPGMIAAYRSLRHQGIAHSAEVWAGDELVGGLYGVSLGAAFFGESMFSRATDASKVALVRLAGQLDAWGFEFIDCQMPTPHLARLGAEEWPRQDFLAALERALERPQHHDQWAIGGASPLTGHDS